MNKESNKVKELCEFIWQLEEKHQLFDLNVEDVYIWEYIRMQVYYKLAITLGVLSPPGKKISPLDRLKILIKGFKNIFTDNFWTLKKCDTVFFSHPRSVLVDNAYIDIYTEYLIHDLSKNERILDFETDYQGSHIRNRKHNVHKLDWIKQLIYLKYFFIRKKRVLNTDQISLIKSIENEILEHYGVKFSLLNLLESKVKLFNLYYDIYLKIFNKVSPSTIYVVVSYYFAPIIKAAKKHNIEVKEVQHGIITRYHLGYSFPLLKKPLRYFPDKLLVWDENWKKIANYPILDENIIVDKFQYLEEKKNQFANSEKIKNTFLILSQTAISENIAKKIIDNLDFFKGKKIIYKLHPGEFEIWKKNSCLIELTKILDIEVVTNQKNLYYLMSISEYQVGVFSTALYEGIEFDCKTILLDVDGIEYMEDFIKVNEAIILR